MPGARLAVVEAKLLRALEALLDRPAQAGCAGKLGQGHAGRGEHEIVGPLVRLLPAAAGTEPVLEGRVTGRRQGDPRPIVEAKPLRSLAGRMRGPGPVFELVAELFGAGLPQPVLVPEAQAVVGAHREHVRLSTPLQHAP